MTVTETQTYQNWIGQPVTDTNGDKIGKVAQIYVDNETSQPAWVTVNTGLFRGRSSFVPLQGAQFTNDALVVAYDKEIIKDAPQIEDDGTQSPDEEQQLYAYYGQAYAPSAPTGQSGYDRSGQTTDNAMTRSEERLVVGTNRQEVGRARLRKYVVTENVQTTVPVSHEEVRIEREPITEGNYDSAVSGPNISEEEHEVVLTAERPVVQKEVVPVERVRLTKETFAEEAVVNDEVRKEQFDTDGVEGYDGR